LLTAESDDVNACKQQVVAAERSKKRHRGDTKVSRLSDSVGLACYDDGMLRW